ncbi:hypothetical protein [Catenulispora sp. GAS73]|uniref:hypothetical protein n=1 Tax=Catenulispora sp. GAS73 TaxID=3156269 RepID=UPI0035178DEE
MHILTHGMLTPSGLFLVGADGEFSPDTDVAHWIATVESFDDRPTTLFLLDTCHSGDAARLPWLAAAGDGTKAWVIAASTKHDAAYDGVFSTAVAQVLAEIADGSIDVYPSRYIPFGVLVEQIRRRVAAIGVREQVVTGTPVDGAPEPPFVPNPRQPADPGAAHVANGSDEVLRPFLDMDVALDAAHFANRAAGWPLDRGLRQGVFTGRRELLRELSRWMEDGGAPLRVVTGGAGSGKSAVLGMLVCAAHRDLRAATVGLREAVLEDDLPGVIENLAGLHLRERDLRAAVQGLRRQLNLPSAANVLPGTEDDADALVAAIITLPNPPVIVVDALDEAVGQEMIVGGLLSPLAVARRADGAPACRLLVGTRPWEEFEPLFRLAKAKGTVVDLDAIPSERLHRELVDYVTDLLATGSEFTVGVRRETAKGVANALVTPDRPRGGEFLSAALYTNLLVQAGKRWLREHGIAAMLASVPTGVPELLALDLAQLEDNDQQLVRVWALPVLTTIAHGHGSGMPATVIRRLAPVFAEANYCEEGPAELSDIVFRQVLSRVRFYLRSAAGPDGLTEYRLFHQSLVDHLCAIDDERAYATLGAAFDRLVQPAALTADGLRDWDAAEPYVRRHWLEHAVEAGRLEEALDADSTAVREVCNSRRNDLGRLAAAIWRETERVKPATAEQWRSILSLNATRYGSQPIASRVATHSIEESTVWRARWSTGGQLSSPALRATIAKGEGKGALDLLACLPFEGQTLAITRGTQARIWDLSTGREIDHPLTRAIDWASVRSCTLLDGRPHAITQGDDKTVRIWDLTTGRRVGQALMGNVTPLTCTMINGYLHCIAGGGSFHHRTLEIWDLSSGQRTVHVRDSPSGPPECVAIDGRPHLVAHSDRGLQLWDLISGLHAVHWLPVHATRFACTVIDGQPHVVTGDNDKTLRIWDLSTGQEIGKPLIGHEGSVTGVACTEIDGRPHAVTGGSDHTVRIWDLTTGGQVGQPLIGHTDWVYTVECTVVDGRPYAVTGSSGFGHSDPLHIWDLSSSGHHAGRTRTGHTRTVRAAAVLEVNGQGIVVTVGLDAMAYRWDLVTGQQVGSALSGHLDAVNAVACTVIEGRPHAVTGSSDKTLRIWDLTTGKQIGSPLTGHHRSVTAVACTAIDGKPHAVSGSSDETVRIWDLTTGQQVGPVLIGHDDWVNAVACTDIDGRPHAVTGGGDKSLRVWDLTTCRQVGAPLTGHVTRVTAVACTIYNGRPHAVTGSSDDGTVLLWDLTAGTQPRPIPADCYGVTMTACATIGGRAHAVTSGTDNMLRFWDLTHLHEVSRATLPYRPRTVAFSGEALVVGYGNEVACFDYISAGGDS